MGVLKLPLGFSSRDRLLGMMPSKKVDVEDINSLPGSVLRGPELPLAQYGRRLMSPHFHPCPAEAMPNIMAQLVQTK